MNPMLAWMAPLGVGASLMFLLDPADGRRRRAHLRNQAVSATRRSTQLARGTLRDLVNRGSGAASRLRLHREHAVDDAVLDARVRTAIGRVSTHSGAIAVACVDGIVELNGPVFAHEHGRVIAAVQQTPGVLAVVDHMSQHEDAGRVPGLQGEGSLPARTGGWSPIAMCTACTAAALLFYAAMRRVRAAQSVLGVNDAATK